VGLALQVLEPKRGRENRVKNKGEAQQLGFAVFPARIPGVKTRPKKGAQITIPNKRAPLLCSGLAQDNAVKNMYNTSARLLSRTMLRCIPCIENRMQKCSCPRKKRTNFYIVLRSRTLLRCCQRFFWVLIET
jgi:hypothetical protein